MSVKEGCNTEGILPGGLKVRRRAKDLFYKLSERNNYAQVNDENGNRISSPLVHSILTLGNKSYENCGNELDNVVVKKTKIMSSQKNGKNNKNTENKEKLAIKLKKNFHNNYNNYKNMKTNKQLIINGRGQYLILFSNGLGKFICLSSKRRKCCRAIG